MLTDRREGVVYLFWCAQTVAAVATYVAWIAFVRFWHSLQPLDGTKVTIYLLGVVVASFALNAGQHNSGHRLTSMKIRDAVPYTMHQLLRYIAVLVTLAVLIRDHERTILFGYLANLALVLALANMYLPPLIAWLVFRGSKMPTLLVADGDEVAALFRMMSAREHLGMYLVGWVGTVGKGVENLPLQRLGGPEGIAELLQEYEIRQVLISQLSHTPEEGRSLANRAEEVGCRVRFVMHVQRYFPDQPLTIEQEGPFTLLSAAHEPLENPLNRLLKRGFDLAISIPVVCLILPPLLLVAWLMQRRQSPGPLLYRQTRSGLDHRRFLIYKIRTMHVSAASETIAVQARRGDPRVYPFGLFLRRTSLDELPQFLNVVRGDMSVIGPRPHLLQHDEEFSRIVNAYYTRHFVKPGITGLAQCNGLRGEVASPALLEKRVRYDMRYIREWTLTLDLRIFFKTAWQVLFPPQTAY